MWTHANACRQPHAPSPAGGEHDFDAVAAIQTSVLPGAAASVSYVVRGDGALHRAAAAATNADVVATAAAAARAMRIGSGDVVAVTAPLGTHFGFAAGFAAANGVHAKIGAVRCESAAAAAHARIGRGCE